MSPVREPQTDSYSSNHAYELSLNQQSRSEKATSFVSEVLPQALNLGLRASRKTERGSKSGALGQSKTSGTAAVGLAGLSTTVGDVLPMVSSWAGIAGGVLGAADIAMNWGRSTPTKGAVSGSAIGATVGTCIAPGVGTAIGAAIGAVGGGLLGSIKTGKHKDQKVRDAVRAYLVAQGVLASDYSIGLANGTRFNIGVDGGPKKELGGRRPFEVNMQNPLATYAISWMNPAISVFSQGNEKVQSDFVGYFANAALSNAQTLEDLRANIEAIHKQLGLNDENLTKATTQAAAAGLITDDVAAAWLNGIAERGLVGRQTLRE